MPAVPGSALVLMLAVIRNALPPNPILASSLDLSGLVHAGRKVAVAMPSIIGVSAVVNVGPSISGPVPAALGLSGSVQLFPSFPDWIHIASFAFSGNVFPGSVVSGTVDMALGVSATVA
jgi:hypothetical protein